MVSTVDPGPGILVESRAVAPDRSDGLRRQSECPRTGLQSDASPRGRREALRTFIGPFQCPGMPPALRDQVPDLGKIPLSGRGHAIDAQQEVSAIRRFGERALVAVTGLEQRPQEDLAAGSPGTG